MARIFRALLIAAVNAIQEFFAFATDNGESEVGDSVKLNDGMATSNYDWSAYPSDTEITGDYTQTGTIEKVKQIGNDFVYGMQEPEQDNKDVTISAGKVYYAYTNENDQSVYATDDPINGEFVNWTQPILSANGTLGGNSFAVYSSAPDYQTGYEPYKAFDNNNGTCWSIPTSGNPFPVDLIMYNPNPLKVTALHWEVYDYNRRPTSWEWYGSNDNETYTLISSGTNSSNDFTLHFTPSAAYKYHKFKTLTANNYLNAKQITLTAKEQITPSTLYNSNFQPLNPQPEFNVLQQGLVNATEVGDLNNTDGVYSGFDTSSSVKEYIISTKKFNFLADTWEIMTKVKFTASKLTIFMGSGFVGSESNYSISLGADASNHINVYLTSSPYSWNIAPATASTATFDLNKWYWIKLYFTGTAYNVDVSETGEFNGEESNFINISSSTKVYNANNYIMWGCNPYGYSGTHNLAGEIDMKETYFTCDNDKTTLYNSNISITVTSETPNITYNKNTDNNKIKSIECTINTVDNTTINSVTISTPNQENSVITTSANITTSNNDNVVSGTDWHIFNLTTPQNITTYIQSGGIEFTPLNMPLLLKNDVGVGLLLKNGNNAQYRNHWVINRDYDLHYQELQFSTNVSNPTILVDINNVNTNSPYYFYSGDTYKYKISKEGYCDYKGSGTATYTSADGKITTVEAELVASNGTVDVTNYEYTLNNTGNMVLTKYIGSSTDVTVPNI